MSRDPASRDEALWSPDRETVTGANLTEAMAARRIATYDEFHSWTATKREAFWADTVARLGIVFATPPHAVVDDSDGPEAPRWLPGALLNIAASCFAGDPEGTAVVYRAGGAVRSVTRGDLLHLVMRVVDGLGVLGVRPGDRVGIAMPMTVDAVAAYLGIVWAGAVVVSIADSFAPDEIGTRLRITDTATVVTQDVVLRAGKQLPMYEKVREAGTERCIVVETGAQIPLHEADVSWASFLGDANRVAPVAARPDAPTNILFSSGTTGEPKAIPWTHLTPIKAASDGFYHQDIHPTDVVAWPTNLGWMMGPWLIYATLVNGAAMALFDDVPTGDEFGRFVESAGVTILGVVPSLVSAWRSSGCMEPCDWSRIRLFSSTGEASNASDMAYLMALAGGKPVIEYCGGTEIGGAYISGTVLQPAVPGTFTTSTVGLDVRILDEDGNDADNGELYIVPPSIGLSTTLLNRDHHEVYYAGVPSPDGTVLRRHGDHMERLPNGYYRALGRVDDTMNLGGIKVSSAEIERVVGTVPGVAESAAIAVPPDGGGPSRLVIFAVSRSGIAADPAVWRDEMQARIRRRLNPLFRIHEVVVVDALPRTASNKVMRRALRSRYSGGGP